MENHFAKIVPKTNRGHQSSLRGNLQSVMFRRDHRHRLQQYAAKSVRVTWFEMVAEKESSPYSRQACALNLHIAFVSMIPDHVLGPIVFCLIENMANSFQ